MVIRRPSCEGRFGLGNFADLTLSATNLVRPSRSVVASANVSQRCAELACSPSSDDGCPLFPTAGWTLEVGLQVNKTTHSAFRHPMPDSPSRRNINMWQLRSTPRLVSRRRIGFGAASGIFIFVLTLIVLLAVEPARAAEPPVPAAPAVHLQQVVSGLTAPVDVQSAHDGTSRLFVVEQGGTIRIVKGTKLLAAPFLNISSIIVTGGEKGLLGVAFHPQYKTNGRVFVNYTRTVS